MQKDENLIECPLVDNHIEIGDCVVFSDVAAGMLKEDCIPKEYRKKDNWREICKNCKYYDM